LYAAKMLGRNMGVVYSKSIGLRRAQKDVKERAIALRNEVKLLADTRAEIARAEKHNHAKREELANLLHGG